MNRFSCRSFFLLALAFTFQPIFSQTLISKTGFIGFYSKTPFEDIRGENNQTYGVVDPASQHLAFAALVRGFIFPKELMQEHFNENYVESEKFPRCTFSGQYTGEMNLNQDGIYPVVIKGDLTLHGVTKPLEMPAWLEVKGYKIRGTSAFKLKPEDFNIIIPGIVREKIAKEIDVKVQIDWTRNNN